MADQLKRCLRHSLALLNEIMVGNIETWLKTLKERESRSQCVFFLYYCSINLVFIFLRILTMYIDTNIIESTAAQKYKYMGK